jgi:phage terminase large subunit
MSLSQKQANDELWIRGNLIWKCHPIQKEMYKIFNEAPAHSTLVWLLARQSGKSYLLAILALEQANRQANSIVKMVTDTKLHLKSIFEKIFEELLSDCPQAFKPEFKEKTYTYYFPNGSQVQLAGTDNKHYEKLRGQKAHLVLIDEAGFCNDFSDVVDSVLFPTTTHTGGKIVMASTPPEQLDHDFFKYIEVAESEKFLTKKTIYENPLLAGEQIQQIIKKMGGVGSERFRREYLCEIIKDPNMSVIPEFDDDLIKQIVKEWPKPPFFDSYEAMDLGGVDLTFVVFGYYDFRADKIVIEDELIMDFTDTNNTIAKLTENIGIKEKELWTNPLTLEIKTPYIRVSDIDYIVTGEILKYSNYKMNFQATKKDENHAAINDLRHLLASKKIIIHPRCINLIRHLKNVRWASKTNKLKFARSPDNGHYDGVDALKYMVRSIIFTRNPYPANYDYNMKDLYVVDPQKFENKQIDAFKKIFNIRQRR